MNFFTKNKLIAGVLGLMAIVSVVNTQAILNLTNYITGGENSSMSVFKNDRQEAQILSSSGNCIKLSPASNNHTSFIDPANFTENFDGLSKHMFVVGLKIKNTCSRSISIIKDGYSFPNGVSAFQNSKLEDFPNINNQTASSQYSFSGPHPSAITDIYGLMPTSLNIPNSNLNGVIQTGDGEMKVTNIPANGEREFILYSYANANNQGVQHNTRLSLKKIRWFLTQNYNDNILTNNEVKVYSLSSSDVEKYRTSYARFLGENTSGDCAKGTIIGYDSNGSPIFCGDQIPQGGCAEGTIIGYDSNGSPVFCGDEVVDPNDCAKGTIIGYDSNGSPIFCGDSIPQGGCAEGTIIGYDQNGSPIFCGDQNTNKPCAPGTIIGYNKDGTPIYCQ